MSNRTVKALLYAEEIDMGGMPVRQAFPTRRIDYFDPFLLLHHANVKVPVHVPPAKAGVGPHPHRGFSPVSFIFKGGVHHRDSRGNNSIIYEGGTQWMNSGMGMIHSERPPHNIHEIGGEQELIQMWVNTPAIHKMDQPQYIPLQAADTPVYETGDHKVRVSVVAGDLKGLKGPISSHTVVNAATIMAQPGGSISIELPETHNAFIYVLSGKIRVADYGEVDHHYAVLFEQNGTQVTFEAIEESRLLLMSGQPLNEPVASHGPFVMNNETQIMEAFRDYRMGRMGVLVEEDLV